MLGIYHYHQSADTICVKTRRFSYHLTFKMRTPTFSMEICQHDCQQFERLDNNKKRKNFQKKLASKSYSEMKINEKHLLQYTDINTKLWKYLLDITNGNLKDGKRSIRAIMFHKKMDFAPIKSIISKDNIMKMMIIIQGKLRESSKKTFEDNYHQKLFIKNVLMPEAITFYLKDIWNLTSTEAETYIGILPRICKKF